MKKVLTVILITLLSVLCVAAESAEFADKVVQEHELRGQQAQQLKKILTGYPSMTRNIGTEDMNQVQGPNNSWHPVSRQQCVEEVLTTGKIKANAKYERICGAKWMAPVPDETGSIDGATVCIDQFEFPNMPCEYPMVWAPAAAAKAICESMGKRICNSHEWEGSCSGAMDQTDPYLFGLGSLQARRSQYNQNRERVWAYQWIKGLENVTDTRAICGVYDSGNPDYAPGLPLPPSNYYISIGKSKACHSGGSDYRSCGSNTFPAGYKYLCRTREGVYDMHGNVAEVMNFPQSQAGLAQVGNTDRTERKGSFFVYRSGYADDCRVRQPYEHFNNFATDKHSYYQEGFRCCKSL